MTHENLKAWRECMGYTQRRAAEALGVSLVTYQRMERGANFDTGRAMPIDRRTALACAALSAGLAPWGSTAEEAPSTPSSSG